MTTDSDDLHIGSEAGLVAGHSGNHVFNRSIGADDEADGSSEIALARCALFGGNHHVRLVIVDEAPACIRDAAERSLGRHRLQAVQEEGTPVPWRDSR